MMCVMHHNPPGGSLSSCSDYGNHVRILVLFRVKTGLFATLLLDIPCGSTILCDFFFPYSVALGESWVVMVSHSPLTAWKLLTLLMASAQCSNGPPGTGRPLNRGGCSYPSSWRPIAQLLSVGLWVGVESQNPAFRLLLYLQRSCWGLWLPLWPFLLWGLRSLLTAWWQDEPRWPCQVFWHPQGSCSIPGPMGASESYIFRCGLSSLMSWYAIVCLSHGICFLFSWPAIFITQNRKQLLISTPFRLKIGILRCICWRSILIFIRSSWT